MRNNNNSNCKSVAILSGKGGTGKSQISVSLGYALSHCGFRTLLLDLDLFTHGMTFYSLAEVLEKPKYHLMDCLSQRCSPKDLSPVQIRNEFCNKKLFVLPNINRKRDYQAELNINENYSNLHSFSKRVDEILGHFKSDFDYIIIDTRGGTDYTTIAATKCSDGHIIVTEADKPSWDTGRVLLDSIYENNDNDYSTLGFIINKNVLPSEAIEAFLRKEWETSHLTTMQLDPSAVKCFQEDKVPISENIGSDFSNGILKIIKKAFVSEAWTIGNETVFENLMRDAEKRKKQNEKIQKFRKQSERFGFIFRSYAFIIIFGLIYYQKTNTNSDSLSFLFENNILLIVIGFLVIFSFLTDPIFIRLLFRKKEKASN